MSIQNLEAFYLSTLIYQEQIMQMLQKVRAQEMIISKLFTITITKKSFIYEKNQTLKISIFIIHKGTGLRRSIQMFRQKGQF